MVIGSLISAALRRFSSAQHEYEFKTTNHNVAVSLPLKAVLFTVRVKTMSRKESAEDVRREVKSLEMKRPAKWKSASGKTRTQPTAVPANYMLCIEVNAFSFSYLSPNRNFSKARS